MLCNTVTTYNQYLVSSLRYADANEFPAMKHYMTNTLYVTYFLNMKTLNFLQCFKLGDI